MPSLPDLSPSTVQGLFGSALAVAVLAAIESLLSARVADGMSDGRSSQPEPRTGRPGAGEYRFRLVRGMPATGAIARTAVNVRAGASPPVSTQPLRHLLIII